MICKYFDKKDEETKPICTETRIGISDQQLGNELQKYIIRKFKKHQYSHLIEITF